MRNISSDKIKRYKELLAPSTPLGKEDGKVLREVLDQFPYTAEAAVLFSAWQKHFEPTAFNSNLKYASLFAGNRLVFNLLIQEREREQEQEKALSAEVQRRREKELKSPFEGGNRGMSLKESPPSLKLRRTKEKEQTKESSSRDADHKESKKSKSDLKREELEAQIQARLKAIKEKEKVSDTDHSGGRGELNDHSGTDPERSEGTIKEKEKERDQDPLALIDRFLKEEPKIKPARDYESKGEVDPDKSIVDEGGMVSETLARIHANQGNFRKAIEIYNKLSLKFPGKSSYFAARIKELQEKQGDK